MRWNNSATWDNTLVWTNSDDMGSILSETESKTAKVAETIDQTEITKSYVNTERLALGALTNDAEITAVHTRLFIDKVVIINSTSNIAQLSCGTATGGTQIFTSQTIAASGATKIDVGRFVEGITSFFLEASQGGDTWNDAELEINFLSWKL